MHDNKILVDWSFSSQETIKKTVEENYPNEIHRWPLLRAISSEGYVWKNKIILILRNQQIGVDTMGKVEDLPFSVPLDTPMSNNIQSWHEYLIGKFALTGNDFILILPITEGKNASERWQSFSEADKNLWNLQIMLNVKRQYYQLKGFDVMGGFFIPPGYNHLVQECQFFFKDNPDYNKNVFIMMKFDNNIKLLDELYEEIRSILINNNLNPVRADVKMYPKDRDLWNNVCVYMICSKYGIALLENVSRQEFNPNVAIEYGFMRALDKHVLLLADENFPRERADVVGKERLSFSIKDLNSMRAPVVTWIKEII